MNTDFRHIRNWRTKLGRRGESAACRLLTEKGCTVLARNCRPSAHSGELDIVAMDGESLVFVEVKTRYLSGRPGRNLKPAQKKRIRRGANSYLRNLDFPDVRIRFDLMEVIAGRYLVHSIVHRKNAFGMKRRGGLF